MAIWKLTPTARDLDDWRLSSYRGPVIVRAHDEDEARSTATSKFCQAAMRTTPLQDILLNPWRQSELVSCELLKDSGYAEDGPAEVLYP